MGVLESGLGELRRVVASQPALRLAGIVTHLPMADEDETFTATQMTRFEKLLADTRPESGDTVTRDSAAPPRAKQRGPDRL